MRTPCVSELTTENGKLEHAAGQRLNFACQSLQHCGKLSTPAGNARRVRWQPAAYISNEDQRLTRRPCSDYDCTICNSYDCFVYFRLCTGQAPHADGTSYTPVHSRAHCASYCMPSSNVSMLREPRVATGYLTKEYCCNLHA